MSVFGPKEVHPRTGRNCGLRVAQKGMQERRVLLERGKWGMIKLPWEKVFP